MTMYILMWNDNEPDCRFNGEVLGVYTLFMEAKASIVDLMKKSIYDYGYYRIFKVQPDAATKWKIAYEFHC